MDRFQMMANSGKTKNAGEGPDKIKNPGKGPDKTNYLTIGVDAFLVIGPDEFLVI